MPELQKRKKCKICGRKRFIKFFNRNCQAKDGIRIYCRDCQNRNYEQYYVRGKKQVIERTAKYKMTHKDYCSSYASEYRAQNREVLNKKNREYYQENKPRVLERTKKWSKSNRDKRSVIEHRYRAKKLNQMGKVSPNIENILWEIQDGSCYYCGVSLEEAGYHQEHKMPISRGGLHDNENICLSCPECNFKKGSKTEKEFCSLGGV